MNGGASTSSTIGSRAAARCECLWVEADTSLSGHRVARIPDYLVELRGRANRLLTDNGPEFAGGWSEHSQPEMGLWR